MTANVGPTNPFHIARAYGTNSAGRAAPVKPVAPVAQVSRAEVASNAPAASGAKRPDSVAKIVGAVVPGGVDFQTGTPTESLSFYRHPADKNAAATGVTVGRSLDVCG